MEKSKQKSKTPKYIKEISEDVKKVGNSSINVGTHLSQGIYEIGKIGIDTSKAVGKDIYKVGKAGVKTGIAVTKGVSSMLTFPIKKRRSIWDFFWKSKQGIITGAADNDPAGIVTYVQTGAIAGLNLLWLVPLLWPLLVAVEEMSARLGIITKKGVNRNILENFGLFWAWLAAIILFICNTLTIGANIAAMADISSILTSVPAFYFVIILGAFFIYLIWRKGYPALSRYLFLLTPFFLLYLVSSFYLNVPWGEALRNTFLPIKSENFSFAMIAVAFLGTTLSPYLIYWETAQEIEAKSNIQHLKREKKGVVIGMFFTQFITFFITVAAATAFAGNNQVIETATEAALALKPFGNFSFLFFSIGILASGLLAVPVLAASTGYTIANTVNWRGGLNIKFNHARGFYFVIFVSIIVGIIISLVGLNPILMLLYSQVLNGILMPVLMIFLLLITNNKKIMGDYNNGFWSNFGGIFALLIFLIFDLAMFLNWLR